MSIIGQKLNHDLPPSPPLSLPFSLHAADTREPDLGQDPETTKQLAAIQKEVRAIETKSELEIQNVSLQNTCIYCIQTDYSS